jgi:hypothetical protein
MKSERMRNHKAHIMYTLEILLVVLYTLRSVPVVRKCCTNIQRASKPLVTMDSVPPVMIPSLTGSIINASFSACILFTSQFDALSIIFPVSPKFLAMRKSISISCVTNLGQSRLFLWVHSKSTMCAEQTCIAPWKYPGT